MNSLHLRRALAVFFVAVVSAACSSGSTSSGSCSVKGSASQIGFCADYIGSGFTASSTKSACTAEKGAYSSSACAPPAPSKGTCDIGSGTAAEIKYYFTSSGTGGNDAKTECTALGGTFSAS